MNDVARITKAIASGDPEAFAVLYKEKFAYVYTIARRFTRLGEDLCLDIVQEAMMRIIRHMKTMHSEEQLNRWLGRVTRTVAVDVVRKEHRRMRHEQVFARRQHADSHAEQTEKDLDWIQDELSRLDALTAQILRWRFRAGLTLNEIGQRIGIKTGAVDGRIKRAIRGLRQRAAEVNHE